MLVMYFGMEEFASGVAVNRKVSLVARTLSDLTSQSSSVVDADLASFGQTAKAIMTPYDPSILVSSITEVYVDPTTHVARVQWSKASTFNSSGNVVLGTSSHSPSDIITIPAALAVRNDPGDFTNNAAKESAKRTAGRLTAASTLIADLVNTGKVKIVAAIYDLQTGVVTYLD